MKINNIFIKLLVSILIVLTLANFISSTNVVVNYSFANSVEQGEEKTNSLFENLISKIGNAIINFFKGIILLPFRAVRSLNYLLASSAGTTGNVTQFEITPFDIFFNRFTLLDANIFSTTDRDGTQIDADNIVFKIRTNAAVWYYAIRTIAISIIGIMLVWNLVRAISKGSSPEQKSVAKNALTDWVLSFALVMFMHIIIIIVLNFNDMILGIIESITPQAKTSDFLDALENAIFSTNLVLGVAALIVYALLNWQTLKYILIYIQRLLTIVLLVMISPLVPVTYSTDRMRGGRGAALNGWLKELLFNVFVQSLHAIVYAALVGVAMAALTSQTSITGIKDLGTALVAIASMLFVKYAERMVKTIFGFDTSQVLNTNVFANAATTIGNFSQAVRNTVAPGSAPNNPVSFGQNVNGGTMSGGQSTPSFNNNVGGGARGLSSRIREFGNSLLGGSRDDEVLTGEVSGEGTSSSRGRRSLEASAEAEADAYARAQASNGKDGKDGSDGYGKIILALMPEGKDQNQELTNKQKESVKELEEAIRNTQEGEKQTKKQADEKKSKETQLESERNAVNRIRTEEESKLREENYTEETTNVIDNHSENARREETANRINELLKDGLNPETMKAIEDLLDTKLKPELIELLEAIADDDEQKLREIEEDLNNQLNYMGLEREKSSEIERRIYDIRNNPEELKKYINSFEEGSVERNYAETYAKLSIVDDIDNEEMTKEDKIKAVVLMNELGKGKESNQLGYYSNEKVTAELASVGATQTSRMVQMAQGEPTEKTEEEVRIEQDSPITDIREISLKATMRDLEKLDPQKYKVEGKLDGEIQTEIEEAYHSKIEKFTKKMGREPKGLTDIYSHMDETARRQFLEYKNNQISAKDLEGDARDLAILERAAKHIGFEMEEANAYIYNINGGKEQVAFSTDAVLHSLRKEKEQQEKQNRNIS